jgi:hypothetical protein
VPWPPRKGELLPLFDDPVGIEEKLRDYCLVPDHKVGGSKANGFLRMLGIDLTGIEYLERHIRIGIADNPISEVRPKKAGAFGCAVYIRIVGVGRYSHRRAWVLTVWQLDAPGSPPRLISAIPRGREKR